MDVRTLISPSAQVVQVTTLTQGDVYKRLDSSGYNGDKLVYGIVVECLNNGDTAAIVAVEFYPPTYGEPKVEIKTFSGSTEMALFPAHAEEFKEHLSQVRDSQRKHLEIMRNNYDAALRVLERLDHIHQTGKINSSTALAISAK
jgi:hypothetical protein